MIFVTRSVKHERMLSRFAEENYLRFPNIMIILTKHESKHSSIKSISYLHTVKSVDSIVVADTVTSTEGASTEGASTEGSSTEGAITLTSTLISIAGECAVKKILIREAKKDPSRALYLDGSQGNQFLKFACILFRNCTRYNHDIYALLATLGAPEQKCKVAMDTVSIIRDALGYFWIGGELPWDYLKITKKEFIAYMRDVAVEKELGIRYNVWLDIIENYSARSS
jgi:hypothetical protein